VDVTPELDAKRANYFQGLIGVLRWMCELERIDILYDVARRTVKLPRFAKGGSPGPSIPHFVYLKQNVYKLCDKLKCVSIRVAIRALTKSITRI
jgi:hypothetical protein